VKNKFLAALGFLLTLSGAELPGQQLSPLAPAPRWADLEPFQETITRDEFTALLDQVYAPDGASAAYIEVLPDTAKIKTCLAPETIWTLRFARDTATEKVAPHFWRPAVAMPPAPRAQPLAGVKIAIDAGHLGGAWARMEERFLQIGSGKPVAEGEMTLRVAELLAPKLEALGAKVSLVRHALEPTTPDRPATLHAAARAELQRLGITNPKETYADPNEEGRGETVQSESELLFYRTSEIRHRAELVNAEIQPDFTLCLHFNAEPWGDPQKPELSTENHLHVLLNGCYLASELRHDDVRYDMLRKLLGRNFPEELGFCTAVAKSMSRETGLPPYTYRTGNAANIAHNPYLWARNLLANRLYQTPVVFIEPYVMNSQLIWDRVQADDYEGEREIDGALRKSLYREYADAVADGLREYYAQARPVAGP
jgi:N-acetylmuramoyl-L-alanine amidase